MSEIAVTNGTTVVWRFPLSGKGGSNATFLECHGRVRSNLFLTQPIAADKEPTLKQGIKSVHSHAALYNRTGMTLDNENRQPKPVKPRPKRRLAQEQSQGSHALRDRIRSLQAKEENTPRDD